MNPKNIANEILARVTLPSSLLVGAFVLVVTRPVWPSVVALAVAASLYVLTDAVALTGLVRRLEALHDKLVKVANRLPRAD